MNRPILIQDGLSSGSLVSTGHIETICNIPHAKAHCFVSSRFLRHLNGGILKRFSVKTKSNAIDFAKRFKDAKLIQENNRSALALWNNGRSWRIMSSKISFKEAEVVAFLEKRDRLSIVKSIQQIAWRFLKNPIWADASTPM